MKATSRSLIGLLTLLLLAAFGVTATAQEDSELRTAIDSFGDEYSYSIGTALDPLLEISGVRWELFRVTPKKEGSVAPDDNVDIVVELGFRNDSGDRARIAVVILFEDESGRKIGERIICDEERLRGGATKVFEQKHEVPGDVLLSTARVYLYCEVS